MWDYNYMAVYTKCLTVTNIYKSHSYIWNLEFGIWNFQMAFTFFFLMEQLLLDPRTTRVVTIIAKINNCN